MKIIIFIFFSVLCVSLNAQDAVDAGLARIDITPEGPIRMSGHIRKLGRDTTTPKSHAKALNRLYAKALAIGSDAQGASVLITVELVGITARITNEVAARLKEKVGLDPAHLTIAASHTHHGPEIGNLLSLTMIFSDPPVSGEELAQIALYTKELTDKLEQVALNALQARAPSILSWGQGSVGFARNRRMIRDGLYIAQQVNPEGSTDHTLPLLRITDLKGKLRGVFLNYACHCTTVPSSVRKFHGDWNGEAQRFIESSHPDAIAMIASGCGADQMPVAIGSPELAAMYGKEIADETERLLHTNLQTITSAPVVQLKNIELPFDHIPTINELEQQVKQTGEKAFNATILLNRLVRGESIPVSVHYPVQTWTFGKALAMIFLGGEATVDYSLRLKKELGANRVWVNSYSNDVQCYIPTKKILREGGYEATGHLPFYNQPSRLSEDVEEMIIGTVHELLPASFTALKVSDNAELFDAVHTPVVLTAVLGKPLGPKVKYMPEWRAFGYFSGEDKVEWEMSVLRAGVYDVFMEWAVSDEEAGKGFVLEAGKKKLEGKIATTGSWEIFKTQKIGQMELSAGKQKVIFRPAVKFDNGSLMDLRQLIFLPVK